MSALVHHYLCGCKAAEWVIFMCASKAQVPPSAVSSSSERVFQIMECLAAYKSPMRLIDLANALNMNQPTVLRYLNALKQCGYIFQDESSSRYFFTWKICKISDQIMSRMGLRDIASPFLQELSHSLSVGSCIVQMQNDNQALYLDVVDNPLDIGRTLKRIGKGAPMYATGSGKLLLSFMSESQLAAYVKSVDFVPLTQYTICDKERLLRDIFEIRARGYALDNEECELGIRCISMPVYDYTGHPLVALSVFSSSEIFTDDYLKETIVPALSAAAKEISWRLGYSLNK